MHFTQRPQRPQKNIPSAISLHNFSLREPDFNDKLKLQHIVIHHEEFLHYRNIH